MKYVIIIPDGAADWPLEELGGRTPLEAADKPYTDSIAQRGRQGTVVTTPPDMPCGSDVCAMSLLGYDPHQYHRGRAPLEAAAMGIELLPVDWVFRVNLVTVMDGLMQDHSAGHIGSDEGRRLLEDLARCVEDPDLAFYPGVSYRNIMVDRSARRAGGRDWSSLRTTPPHDIPGQPIDRYLPTGCPYAELLQRLIAESQVLFEHHEINQIRRDLGELPATHVWPWGQGRKPEIPSFASRFGLKGAMITAVDLMAGIAAFIGWDRLDVPGQTSYHDTDYAAAGRYALQALEKYDIVCVHIESPDEASHAGDAMIKVAAIEAIDRHVVGPILEGLKQYEASEGWCVLYVPDHYTAVSTRKHEPTPPPFAICGTKIPGLVDQKFSEANAQASGLHVRYGHELMEFFLRVGLR